MLGKVATGLLTVALALGVAGAPAQAASKTFKSCSALEAKYPSGVGKPGATDKVAAFASRSTSFKKSTAVFKKAVKANPDLDADHDSIACEKKTSAKTIKARKAAAAAKARSTAARAAGVGVTPMQSAPLTGLPLGAPKAARIKPGRWVVGKDVAAGVWYTTRGCASLLNSTESPWDQVGMVVELRRGDIFDTGCSWNGGYPAANTSSFVVDGMHIVGHNMTPGSWKSNDGGWGCTHSALTLRWELTGSDWFPEGAVEFTQGQLVYTDGGCNGLSRV